MRRALMLCLVPLGLALAARADWPRLPPVTGELAGKFALPALPAAPVVEWKMIVRAAEGGRLRAELVADATGAKLRAHAEFDPATGDGSWRIDAGELDAAVWFPAVAAKLGDTLASAEVIGKISTAGEGGLRGGVPAGSAVLTLAGGRLSLKKPKLEFTGLALRVTLPRLSATAIEGELTFAEGHAADQTWHEGRVLLTLGEDGVLQVSETRVRGLGGTLTAAPFQFKPAQPQIAMTVSLAGIALEEIAALLPPAVSEARGHVDGELALEWNEADGLRFGAGWMRLTGGAPARVRLTPTPGLITAQLSAGNPAFASLKRVELGQTPLNVRLLSAEFQPAGDALGRTATVHLEAEPVDAQLIAPILLEVNVAGPLDQLVKLGLDERVRMGGPPR